MPVIMCEKVLCGTFSHLDGGSHGGNRICDHIWLRKYPGISGSGNILENPSPHDATRLPWHHFLWVWLDPHGHFNAMFKSKQFKIVRPKIIINLSNLLSNLWYRSILYTNSKLTLILYSKVDILHRDAVSCLRFSSE